MFLWSALLAGVLNLVISVWMGRRFGLIGVALGTMLAQVFTNNWYAPYYTLRLYRIRFVEHLRGVVAPACGLLVVTLGAGLGVRVLTKHWPVLPGTLFGLMLTVLLGALYFFRWMTRPEERASLRSRVEALIR